MSKDWEKEFSKQVKRGWYVFPEETEKLFAKQRTQLLKEVREKVIGEDEKAFPDWLDELEGDNKVREIVLGTARVTRNVFREEQLKKLKELEEEGK